MVTSKFGIFRPVEASLVRFVYHVAYFVIPVYSILLLASLDLSYLGILPACYLMIT